jgi:ribosome-associated protein
MTDEALLKLAASAVAEKKGEDVVVLDLRKVSSFTDYFVIASGQNQKQLLAMADAVQEELRKHSLRPVHVEGYPRQEWILLDYSIFVVHVFTKRTRTFYDLERLWGAATKLEVAL